MSPYTMFHDLSSRWHNTGPAPRAHPWVRFLTGTFGGLAFFPVGPGRGAARWHCAHVPVGCLVFGEEGGSLVIVLFFPITWQTPHDLSSIAHGHLTGQGGCCPWATTLAGPARSRTVSEIVSLLLVVSKAWELLTGAGADLVRGRLLRVRAWDRVVLLGRAGAQSVRQRTRLVCLKESSVLSQVITHLLPSL